jgi:hypothetical protein
VWGLPAATHNTVWLRRKKYFMVVGSTKNKDGAADFVEAAFCCFLWRRNHNSGAWLLHCCTVHFSEQFFFFWKTSASELIHSHCSSVKFSFFFVFKKPVRVINSLALFKWKVYFFSEKPVYLIDFTRTVHMNVNIIFFKKKISLRWIKFTRTVISILFLIIFYLIVLHAQKIMETVVLVKWILYLMKL